MADMKKVESVCDDCLRYYDGGPCPDKEDCEPCEDFVLRYFKDTGEYMYMNNKWFRRVGSKIGS